MYSKERMYKPKPVWEQEASLKMVVDVVKDQSPWRRIDLNSKQNLIINIAASILWLNLARQSIIFEKFDPCEQSFPPQRIFCRLPTVRQYFQTYFMEAMARNCRSRGMNGGRDRRGGGVMHIRISIGGRHAY